MANKSRRPGAPPELKIQAEFDNDRPSDIGDYLEQRRSPAPLRPTAPVEPPSPPEPRELPSPRTARLSKANARLELSISAEHKARLEALVQHASTYSVQKDIAAAEVLSALVELAHDALGQVNYASVRPRGAWGSATSRALKSALAHDYSLAISARMRKPGSNLE
jgi:hypothetical protein